MKNHVSSKAMPSIKKNTKIWVGSRTIPCTYPVDYDNICVWSCPKKKVWLQSKSAPQSLSKTNYNVINDISGVFYNMKYIKAHGITAIRNTELYKRCQFRACELLSTLIHQCNIETVICRHTIAILTMRLIN